MTGRTPSFIIVGLVIIMVLLGSFYMSCSSTTAELRRTLVEFEERIRSLTVKNNDHEKTIETINTNKREIEEEKSKIQKQMGKKDSELNELNTKLNEKLAELKSLKTDKEVLEAQLKDVKNIKDTVASKDATIAEIQQELDEQKKSYEQQINDLKQQLENYKQNLNQSLLSIISNERLARSVLSKETVQNASLDIQQPSSNLTDTSVLSPPNSAENTVNVTSILNLNNTDLANNQSQSVVKEESKQNDADQEETGDHKET